MFNNRKHVFFNVFLFDMIYWIYIFFKGTLIKHNKGYIIIYLLTIQLNNHFLDEPNNNYSTTTTFAITDEVDYKFFFFFIELDR